MMYDTLSLLHTMIWPPLALHSEGIQENPSPFAVYPVMMYDTLSLLHTMIWPPLELHSEGIQENPSPFAVYPVKVQIKLTV